MPERKLKVFLSSTAKDLAAFRKAVHARLAASPLFECIRQEDFDAHPHPPVEVCRDQVLQSGLFIGLIGMRRGWEPPDDSSQRSITEMEYDWAKDAAQRFMYVTPDDFPVPGNLRETEDEHRRQLQFRKRTMSDLVVSQNGFASPEALAILIVDRLTDHVLNKPQPPPDDPLKGLPDAVAERILRLLEERGDLKKAEQGGLERDIVLKLAKRIKPDDTLDFDRAVAELENAIAIALDAIARGGRRSNEDDFVNDVLKSVAKHTQAGENERAVNALDDALQELDAREAEQRDTLKRSRLTLLQAALAQDILRRDAVSAASRVDRSIALEFSDHTARFETLRKRQDEFVDEGRNKGVNFSLEIAIEISRLSFTLAHTADQRGAALTDLGIALLALGEREIGTARLNEAVMTFRGALVESTCERAPLDWAKTQNGLGFALLRLGEREDDPARLHEAVAAFREALQERTRERVPLDWAATQRNLGLALCRLGGYEVGTARLDEAITAHREALKEQSREREPLEWARTQNNLGLALVGLGLRESGTARLEESVATYHEALKEATRERVPLNWAMTQSNLGIALFNLGQRKGDTARLVEAIDAFREALTERTRERVPLQWAATQSYLGVALTTLAARDGSTWQTNEAVTAFREALKEWTLENEPLGWANTQHNLGIVLSNLGEREIGTELLYQAAAAFREALKERTREQMPLEWASTQTNLGHTLWRIGQREPGAERLDEAITVYRGLLKETSRERTPLAWASIQNSLGLALTALGERQSSDDRLDEAIAAFREALKEWTPDRVPLDWAIGFGNEGVALMHLAYRRGDPAIAERAIHQIEQALAVMREVNHAEFITFCEEHLIKARAIRERLSTA